MHAKYMSDIKNVVIMPTAIIIGFQYGETRLSVTNPLRRLEAAIIDIYRAYRHSKAMGWDIHLLTDIETPTMPYNIGGTISSGIVDIGITTFLREDRDEVKPRLVTHSRQFDEALNNIKCEDNRCFFYYSGHGVKDALLLPSREAYNFSNIHDTLHRLLPNDGNRQLFSLVDCCHGCNLNLPFKLSLEEKRFSMLKLAKPRWVRGRVIWITSSSSENDAESTEQGSLFTARFFRLISDTKYNLPIILRELQARKDVGQGIYSSHKELPVVWPWFYGSKVDVRPGEDVLRLNANVFK